jgi:hypothetical protein
MSEFCERTHQFTKHLANKAGDIMKRDLDIAAKRVIMSIYKTYGIRTTIYYEGLTYTVEFDKEDLQRYDIAFRVETDKEIGFDKKLWENLMNK